MSITYRIALEIAVEPREAATTFTDFDRGVAACVAHAIQQPGVPVRMFVDVSQNKLIEHHYTVFEDNVPVLDRFMRAGIRKQYGEEPPV